MDDVLDSMGDDDITIAGVAAAAWVNWPGVIAPVLQGEAADGAELGGLEHNGSRLLLGLEATRMARFWCLG